jgi:NADH dehydrogenase
MPTAERTVLVTGAAGGLGVRLVRRLIDRGFVVRGLALPGDPLRRRLDELGCEVREGDVCDPVSLAGVCDGVDTVYHLAAVIVSHDPSVFRRVNRDGTAHVVGAATASGVRHFIYVSSASVTYPKRTPYAESKREAEIIVESAPTPYTIVRPTLVYDAAGSLELSMFTDYLLRYPIVPFIGAGRAMKRPVWSEDLVDGLACIAGRDVAHSKTYNLSGGEAISIADFAKLVLRHRGVEKPFLHVPVPFCRTLARAMRLVMRRPPLTESAIAGIVNDADLDPAEAMRDLGYRPLGVREGFQRCFPIPSHSESIAPEALPTRSIR